ncbi:MAG: putative DNA modification/repair radical SAM protein [Oscillospiraceae bacterium]|nr:putative DNA modification/repair radical SAM protein [Oscillospiraceae bacterium]
MELIEKLEILGDSAKYDAACTSSGVDRRGRNDGGIGNSYACGICHSFAADGRCISLLKVLMTNSCIYNCKYCINRTDNDIPRARFTPEELADITINFYRRNYIEGLFLSSAVIRNPDYTCEQMIECLALLRNKYRFNGYIHAKAIPGADSELISRLGMYADRISVNIELPSQQSLERLAPDKSRSSIFLPMGHITAKIQQNSTEIVKYRHADKFAPAGQSTQMIIGATEDTDYQIIRLSEALYNKYSLKRVFFSAYVPVGDSRVLPDENTPPPLLREHRLYQADWLLRFYGYRADELLDEKHQSFDPLLDPKCNWAVNHPELFPVEINKAPYETLLRVPGIGVKSANRICTARREAKLRFEDLKKLGVVVKRAQYFITCMGRQQQGLIITEAAVMRQLMSASTVRKLDGMQSMEQLSFFDEKSAAPTLEDYRKCLTGQM